MNLGREHARALDAADPLRSWRARFIAPRSQAGEELVYLCGHSLGLQPRLAESYIARDPGRLGHARRSKATSRAGSRGCRITSG